MQVDCLSAAYKKATNKTYKNHSIFENFRGVTFLVIALAKAKDLRRQTM